MLITIIEFEIGVASQWGLQKARFQGPLQLGASGLP